MMLANANSAWSGQYSIYSSNNYWLRVTYPSGTIQIQEGDNAVNICSTRGVKTQVPTWAVANLYSSNYDGLYLDNFFSEPRIAGDYLENGTEQSIASSTALWQSSYVTTANNVRSDLPAGKMVWGNIADWANTSVAAYNQVLDGGVMESAIGQSYSYESSSWASLMNFYKICMNTITPNGYTIFKQDNASTTSFAAMRYGLCSCLLDNGYYYYNVPGPGGGNEIIAFDETSFKFGPQIAGPNSAANGTYSNGGLTVWKQGVWRRDFANGIILVNPRGNGAQTVMLETTYWHLRQSIDTDGVNNAASTTSVTLPDPNVAGTGGAGLVLSRTAT